MLSYGITTAQSVAGPLHQSIEMREVLEAGKLIGPRLFVSPPLWEGNRLFYSFARTLRTPGIAQIEIDKAKRMDADFLKSYVRAPIPVMERIAQGALDLGIPSGTHMVQPGAATGLAGTTHLSATQRMGYGWSKSFVRAITYQDAYDIYAKGDFHLIDTLFPAGALAGLDPGIVSDPRFVLVPPNFVSGLQNAAPPTAAQIATIVNDATQQAKVRAAGALVANGTDSPLVVPGISLHLNLRGAALVQGNLAALQSATRDAAKMAFVGADLGTIEGGQAGRPAGGERQSAGRPARRRRHPPGDQERPPVHDRRDPGAGAHPGAAGHAPARPRGPGKAVPRRAAPLRGGRRSCSLNLPTEHASCVAAAVLAPPWVFEVRLSYRYHGGDCV